METPEQMVEQFRKAWREIRGDVQVIWDGIPYLMRCYARAAVAEEREAVLAEVERLLRDDEAAANDRLSGTDGDWAAIRDGAYRGLISWLRDRR